MLPLDFPKWQLVYYYYRKWASLSDFDLLLDKLRGHVRVKRGQNMEPSVGIIDSQSVRWGTMPPETALMEIRFWKGHSRGCITIEGYAEIMN